MSAPPEAPNPAGPASSGPGDDQTALADVIAMLRRAMRRAARTQDPDNALSVAQLELLSCLAENPSARPSQLARLLRLAPNSITTLVNGLHGRGLLTRAGGDGDRRTVSLRLTEAGYQAVRRWQATNSTILHAATARLHPAWQHLITAAVPALHELIQAIDTLAEPSGAAADDRRRS